MTHQDFRMYIDDRPEEQIFRVHPAVYSDPELFEMEQDFIFNRTWSFLTLESEIPRCNDYVTSWIGRTPVLVARNAQGRINAYINACRHKGATICRTEKGNARYHVCPYHGWAYDSAGKNVDIKDRQSGQYPPAFEAQNHDLVPVARVDTYKGLVFGSLSSEVISLKRFLGDLSYFIDLYVEQGPAGMEIVPGRCAYVYHGNWKMQVENGQDAYHFSSTHGSFAEVQRRRSSGDGNTSARTYDWQKRAGMETGMFDFPYGHTTMWMNLAEPEKRPIYPRMAEIRDRVGELKSQWMLKQRNVVVFPNLQMADHVTPFLRVIRPLSVDRTELRNLVLAPKGEPTELRAWRLRQFEDFINPCGLATPDDVAVFGELQKGCETPQLPWLQGHDRGMSAVQNGANEIARELEIHPAQSLKGLMSMQNEITMHAPFKEWVRLMDAGIHGRPAYP